MPLTRTIVLDEAIRLHTSDGPVLVYFGKCRAAKAGRLCDLVHIDAPKAIRIDRIPRPTPTPKEPQS